MRYEASRGFGMLAAQIQWVPELRHLSSMSQDMAILVASSRWHKKTDYTHVFAETFTVVQRFKIASPLFS